MTHPIPPGQQLPLRRLPRHIEVFMGNFIRGRKTFLQVSSYYADHSIIPAKASVPTQLEWATRMICKNSSKPETRGQVSAQSHKNYG
jgi:hypothetical protein